MSRMNKMALKNAVLVAAVALVVFEGITAMVQLIDPHGGLLRVNYRNPVHHTIIIAAALRFGTAAYCRICKKNRNNK